ncbi:MAG: LacI family DNA-binding transcriptional regulator [Chloroflexi bacterium]|nr:LacI family DNA-binding transcriptional regulator [Chloroflexota bacterium]
MKRVTIKEVAERAGVSYQIVSKVLQNQGRVAPETRARILAAANELGYVPSRIARGLVSNLTQTLGFVAGDLANFFLTQFIVGAEQEARRQGYSFIVVSLEDSLTDVSRELKLLLEEHVDGVLLAAPQLENSPQVPQILAGKLPVVSIHRVEDDFASIVDSDQEQIGAQAVDHLIATGRRHIATITGSLARSSAQKRLSGTQAALHQHGLECTAIEEANWDPQSGYDAAVRLLQRAPSTDAIFVQNDLMALGVLHALYDHSVRIPEDCAVIGCDNLSTSAHTIPPLSSIHIPVHETGRVAVKLLLEAIQEGEDFQQRRSFLPTRVVARQSTGGTP